MKAYTRCSIIFLLGCLVYEQIQSFRLSRVIFHKRFVHNLNMAEYDSELDRRTFASYAVYKGKGAVNLKVIPPTFSRVAGNKERDISGSSGRTVSREGAILFEFAPAKPDAAREYDWMKKSTFSLSATECGDVLAMNIANGKEFLHDPNMGGANAGMLTKKLKLSPMPDEKGIFLSLVVTDKSPSKMSSSCNVPLTLGELEVIRTLLTFSIPRLLAFDCLWDTPSASNNDSQR